MSKTPTSSPNLWLILTVTAGAVMTFLAPPPPSVPSPSALSPSAPAPEIDTAVFGVG